MEEDALLGEKTNVDAAKGEIDADPANTFTYHHLTNSNLIEKVASPIHDAINAWESNREVLDLKQNKVGTTVISQYDYSVNAIGQRTAVSQAGTAFQAVRSIDWGYDPLGQATSAASTENTSNRAYEYDTIGNRKKTANSLTLPPTDNYTANALNQYSTIQEGSAGVSPAYDFDGNATSYPLPTDPNVNSTLSWDAESRLIETQVGTSGPLVRNYDDAQSRRIAKIVGTATTLYLYDDWNVIAEYQGSAGVSLAELAERPPALSKTRLWGLDLSGSMQGAGGVGGLLAETHTSNPQSPIYYPTYALNEI